MLEPDRKKLERANRYIQQKDYKAARAVLKKMDHPTARQWLAQLNQIAPEKHERFDKADKIGLGIVICVSACIGIIACLALGQSIGIIPRDYETETAEAKEKEAARSTDRAIQDMTATIIALTPSSTPTVTNTSTHTPRPSRTPTITATIEATIRPSSTIKRATNQTRYTTEGVNIREGAGTNFDRIGSLPAGYKLTVLGEEDGWYKIEFNNGEGWVAGQFTSANAPPPVSSGSGRTNNNTTGVPGATLQPTSPSPATGACDCYGPDLNCGNFSTHDQAQACFNYCMTQRGYDVFNLDGNDNGLACES